MALCPTIINPHVRTFNYLPLFAQTVPKRTDERCECTWGNRYSGTQSPASAAAARASPAVVQPRHDRRNSK